MAPVTEIAYISLKPGISITGSTTEAQAWSETISTIQAQPGYQRLHWGITLENQDLLMLLIDWDSIDSHKNFIDDPSYVPFKTRLGTIMTGVHLFHITPTPFPPRILSLAPVIEFATFYSIEPGFLSNIEKFSNILEKNKESIDGYIGYSYGESVEEIVKHAEQGTAEAKGKEGKAVTALLGWRSKEDHLKFRETELFKENIGLMREKTRGAELFHVPFTAV